MLIFTKAESEKQNKETRENFHFKNTGQHFAINSFYMKNL